MAHIPEWCDVCKGAKPHYFCETENLYICHECNQLCHERVHIWKELEDVKRS